MLSFADPVRFRRIVAGASLIGFPLAAVASSVIDAEEGTGMDPAELYATLDAHQDAIFAAGLLFALSAVLMIPALGGILHLLRRRGVVLGHVGAGLLLLGAFGHMGYATWQLLLSRVPDDGDTGALIAYLDRTAVVADAVLLPMLLAVPVGLILATLGLRRAGVVPAWVPALTIGTVAVDFLLSSSDDPSKWTMVGIWTLALVAFGYVGTRVLGMTDADWTTPTEVRDEVHDTAVGAAAPATHAA